MSGFVKPTTTQTPDALFDYWLSRLTGAELRVALYAVRRTFGFGRADDDIALEQFLHGITTADGTVLDAGIGLSRRALLYAIKGLVTKGVLTKTRRTDGAGRDSVSNYRLHVIDARRPDPAAGQGLRPLNTTQVPDEIVDYWLPRLSDAELKVLLYVTRRTLGFGKQADVISPDQYLHGVRRRDGAVLDDGCGVSEKHLYRALAGLREKGLITVQRRSSAATGNLASLYTLVFAGELPAILRDGADPRAQTYHPGEDEALITGDTPTRRARPAAQGTPDHDAGAAAGGCKKDRKRVQKRRGEGATRTGRGRNEDRKGYASKVAPQQTDSKAVQETDHQETGDVESRHMPRSDRHDATPRATAEHRAAERAIRGAVLAAVEEFGDAAPGGASVTKALARFRATALLAEEFLALIDEASAQVRHYRPAKPMAYLFTVLDDLLARRQDEGARPDAQPSEPTTITEPHPIWRGALEDLQLVVTPDNFKSYFAPTRALGEQGERLLVVVPDAHCKAWLETKLARRVAAALEHLGHGEIRVEYVVAGEAVAEREGTLP